MKNLVIDRILPPPNGKFQIRQKEECTGLIVPSPIRLLKGGLRRKPSDLHDWRAD